MKGYCFKCLTPLRPDYTVFENYCKKGIILHYNYPYTKLQIQELIQQKTDYWTRTSFSAVVPLRNDFSFYARYGDWLSMLCFFLVLLSVGYGWLTRKR